MPFLSNPLDASPNLQTEIKKHEPFDDRGQEAYLNLIRTAGQLSADFHQLFKQHGLSQTSYNVLRILRGAQDHDDPAGLPCLEVGSRLITRVPDITRLVNRLIEAGLVIRTRTDADRRVARVSITDAGRALLDKLDGPVLEMHHRQLSHLTEKELAEFNRLLEKARAASPPC